jgi:RNA polymerase sigma factor (sigma-70 family)
METATPAPDLTAIVQRERARLGRFIRQRVRSAVDAEDILQDVLFAFVEAFRLPTPIEHASGWLFRAARNRIIDRFRRRREEPLPAVDAAQEGPDSRLDLQLPSPDAGPEAEYARSAVLQALQDALAELPEKQRAVFIAHELEGRSFRDLSEESGTPLNTLLARKRYAVTFLRSRLRTVYDELDL